MTLEMYESVITAQIVSIVLNNANRDRLDQIVGDRNCTLKHVQRAKAVPLSSDRLSGLEAGIPVGKAVCADTSSVRS